MADIISWILFAGGLLLTLAFLAETAAGLLPPRRVREPGSETLTSGAIVIPAQNEAAIIGASLSALKEVMPAGFRILVVADNCTDDTAAVARRLGVEAIERHDPQHRGKGYALAFARDYLREQAPDCVIVLDADCSIDRDSIEALAREVDFSGAAVQARYLLRPLPAVPPLTQISTFAFMIKNFIRQRGLQRLGAPAVLTGSGMAFPWHIFDRQSLGGGTLAEDLALSLSLVREGSPPAYCDTAQVWSDPAPESGSMNQRARWEGGFLSLAASQSLPLLIGGLARFSWPRIWMSLHLFVPPLTLLILVHFSLLGIILVLCLVSATFSPAWFEIGLISTIFMALALTWLQHGQPFLSSKALIRIPFYILWKLPLYWRLVWRRDVRWLRTERL